MAMEIIFRNVGAGHAVHAFAPDGKLVVVDLGCSPDFSPLRSLRASGRTTIDLLVITHPHGDHIDEILLLDKLGFTVRHFWCPRWLTEAEIREANQPEYKAHVDKYLAMTDRYNATIPDAERLTDNPATTGGALIETFTSRGCGRSNINNHSGVVTFTYASSTVVVPGDNESASWQELLKDRQFVARVNKADVFMASHHGRESGYCADVFAGVKPGLFVVSDGKKRDTDATNSYSQQARGWAVHDPAGEKKVKNVVTTRTNGHIGVRLGFNAPDRPFLHVDVERWTALETTTPSLPASWWAPRR